MTATPHPVETPYHRDVAALRRLMRLWLVVGAVAALLCIAGAILRPADFFRGYLLGFIAWGGVSIGSISFLLLQRLTGGAWARVLRPALESAALLLPLVALLMVPLLLGMRTLYPWMDPDLVHAHHHLEEKTAYLNAPFFIGRSALYMAFWIGTALLLVRGSRRLDQARTIEESAHIERGLMRLGAAGMIGHVLLGTFAAVDWMMSLEPLWYSTIYGLYILVGFSLGCLALVVLVAGWLRPIRLDVLHDLGKLLFMMVNVYAYVAVSQFIIIWSGNIPEEVPWYLRRVEGVWEFVPVVLVAVHFVVPFFVLMSRRNKRHLGIVTSICALILVMRVVDLAWLILPAFDALNLWTWLLAAAALAGVGGLWLAGFFWRLAAFAEEHGRT